jgi:uncharacterized protein
MGLAYIFLPHAGRKVDRPGTLWPLGRTGMEESPVKVIIRGDRGESAGAPGGTLLVCFPSAGLASTIVGHFVVRTRDLPRRAVVDSPLFPSATIVVNSLPNPPVRIYGDGSVAVMVSEFPPPPRLLGPLSHAILHWAQSRHSDLVVAVEGILKRKEDTEDAEEQTILAIPSTTEVKGRLEKAGIQVLEEGIVGGLSASLLNEAAARELPLTTVFVTARAGDYPDHRAAAHLLEALDRLVPSLKVDPKPLLVQAELIERAIREGLKLHKPAPAPSPEEPAEVSSMYR